MTRNHDWEILADGSPMEIKVNWLSPDWIGTSAAKTVATIPLNWAIRQDFWVTSLGAWSSWSRTHRASSSAWRRASVKGSVSQISLLGFLSLPRCYPYSTM